MATTMTPADIEDQEFVNSRAEAKRAHLERLSYLRRVDDQERAEAIAEVTGQSGGGGSGAAAEPKVSAFQIAVSVANASDSKAGGDSKPSGAETKASAAAAASAVNKFRLLGDLPSLGGGSGRADAGTLQQDAEVALNLELHKNKHQFMKNASSGGSAADAKEDARKFDPNIPKVRPRVSVGWGSLGGRRSIVGGALIAVVAAVASVAMRAVVVSYGWHCTVDRTGRLRWPRFAPLCLALRFVTQCPRVAAAGSSRGGVCRVLTRCVSVGSALVCACLCLSVSCRSSCARSTAT